MLADVPFHPAVCAWFERTFAAPSPVQVQAWPAIASGQDALISAPTGSGKTLAAFLWSIHRLLDDPGDGDGPRVLYVSPLKALGNDVEKNLRQPLLDILHGDDTLPPLRAAVRTGDSTSADRQRLLRRPPHILITTPESLYLLLTGRRSRHLLEHVQTVIVDEIHALVPNKRGAHLCLSLERLDRICGRLVQRIGLSATQRPLSRIADMLTGGRPCRLIEVLPTRPPRMEVFTAELPLGAIASQAAWGHICDHLAGVVDTHRTTLVFTNTRRLTERLARQLAERLGPERVAAHHGSLSRRLRLDAEQKLKDGRLSVLVATASLELGIDIGHVDVVCQVGSPRSLAVLIQRVGRSGHTLHGTSHGILYPLTRDDLLQCAAAVRAVRRGELDETILPHGPIDILSQQMVATAAEDDDGIAVSDLYALCRRAWPYRNVDEAEFYRLVHMLTDGVAPQHGRRGAWLHWDRARDTVQGRRGARLAAVMGGGAIADEADYEVLQVRPGGAGASGPALGEPGPLAPPSPGASVGRLNEDFAIESMVGDVFQLGSTSWRILRVTQGKVLVEPAPAGAAGIPFWLGEAPGRTLELSNAVSQLREEVVHRPGDWLCEETGLDAGGAAQLTQYLTATAAALGAMPTMQCVVAERFFDDSGGMQLILHAPFGARINRAWGLALRKRFCVGFDFELQAAATDNGVLISLSRKHSFVLDSVFGYVHPNTLHKDLIAAVLQSPMFGQRWRWNATRSLALSRNQGGRRVPVPILRMRAEDMLATVFPEQVQCQDNRSGPIVPPSHPLVDETLRDCLEEALDETGLRDVLVALHAGKIRQVAVDSVLPSPMSHELLHAMPYAFLDDAPLEERRARAVSLRPTDPDHADARLDLGAIRDIEISIWPQDVEDLLARVGWLTAESLSRYPDCTRLRQVSVRGRSVWVGPERYSWLAEQFDDVPSEALAWDAPPGQEEGAQRVIMGWLECLGPVTVARLSQLSLLSLDSVYQALLALETRGLAMQGHYTGQAVEWCHRDVLSRIHRETLRRLRASIEPVSQERYEAFLASWRQRKPGDDGLLDLIGQCQGLERTLDDWDSLLGDPPECERPPECGRPARLWDDVERLCLAGEVAWACLTVAPDGAESSVPHGEFTMPRQASGREVRRFGLFLRESHPWLLPSEPVSVSDIAVRVQEHLSQRGACFPADIATALKADKTAVADALWELAAAGQASSDSLGPLRSRGKRESRWFCWPESAIDADTRLELQVRQLLRRCGIVFRETSPLPWGKVRTVLSRLELRGEVRMGRFLDGVSPEQYALPGAVERLRTAGASASGENPPAWQLNPSTTG